MGMIGSGDQSSEETGIFTALGCLASTFDAYYNIVGNKVISKHLPMFLSWMEDRDHLDTGGQRNYGLL